MLNPCGRESVRKVASFSYGFLPRMAYYQQIQQSMPKNMMVCHPCQYQSIAENQPTGIDQKGCPFNTWKDDQRFCRRRWSFKTFCWFDFVDFGGLMVASAFFGKILDICKEISQVFWRNGTWANITDFDSKKRRKIKSKMPYTRIVCWGSERVHHYRGGTYSRWFHTKAGDSQRSHWTFGWFPDLFSRTKMIWNTGRSNGVEFM